MWYQYVCYAIHYLGPCYASYIHTCRIIASCCYNTAKLSGSNEVPPVTTTGSGIAIFHILPVGHQEVLNYELDLKNIKSVTGVHIHGKQGENGPGVAGLFNPV